MTDSYLKIAENAIREMAVPLHPKEIIEVARKKDMIPEHLYGKTQYKTLAARLSTDIRLNERSIFFRTGSNRFYLRELNFDKYPEYMAPRRMKTLHNEKVLVINDLFLREENAKGIIINIAECLDNAFRSGNMSYVVRKIAEKRSDIKQVIAYTIIYRDNMILTYRRGNYNSASDEIQGKRSVGFGGHVSDSDLGLFDNNRHGIIDNAQRELMEELVFNILEVKNIQKEENSKILCGINTYDSTDAEKHIAVVVVYFCTMLFSPKKNELSINDLRWINIKAPENDLDAFEPWSKIILENIYRGELKIGCK